jgi:hypothetical protein
MKAKIILAALLVYLVTTGSSCIKDTFLVVVNFPFSGCYDINPGDNPVFGGFTSVTLRDQVPASFRDDIREARYYDIQVWTTGTYAGNINGTASINGITMLNYSGAWSDFSTPQSLLGNSPYITPQTPGLLELARVLLEFPTNPNVTLTLASSGSVSSTPVPDGLQVCVQVLTQGDAEVNQ